uniref:Uncharacterized protein n=1 Tax=Lotharella vacuolata TaxID=74820 RepID=A0A0H5BL14_9EUKA|nr:hypothetical protein [Lotharella vacuolata]
MMTLQLYYNKLKQKMINKQFCKINKNNFIKKKYDYKNFILEIKNIIKSFKTIEYSIFDENEKYINNKNNYRLINFFLFFKKKILEKEKKICLNYFFLTFLLLYMYINNIDFINKNIIDKYYLYYVFKYKKNNQKIHTNEKYLPRDYSRNSVILDDDKSIKNKIIYRDLNAYLLLKSNSINEKIIRNNIFKNIINIESYKKDVMLREPLYNTILASVDKNQKVIDQFYHFIKKIYITVMHNNLDEQYFLKYTNNYFLNFKKYNFYRNNITAREGIIKSYFDSKCYSFKEKYIIYHNIYFKISKYLLNYVLLNFMYVNEEKSSDIKNYLLKFSEKLRFSYGNVKGLDFTKDKNIGFDLKKKIKNKNSNDKFSKLYILNYIDKTIYHIKDTKFRYFFGIVFFNYKLTNKKINFERSIDFWMHYKYQIATINYDKLLNLFVGNYKNKKNIKKMLRSKITSNKILYTFIKESEINPSIFKIKTNWKCKNVSNSASNVFIKFNKLLFEKKIRKIFDKFKKKNIKYYTESTKNLYKFKFYHEYKKNYEKKKAYIKVNLKVIEIWKTVYEFCFSLKIYKELRYFSKQIYIKNFKKFFIFFQIFNSFFDKRMPIKKNEYKFDKNQLNFEFLKNICIQQKKIINNYSMHKIIIIRNSKDFRHSLISKHQSQKINHSLYNYAKIKNVVISFQNKKKRNNFIIHKYSEFEKLGIKPMDIVFCLKNFYFGKIGEKFCKNNNFELHTNNFRKFIIIFFSFVNNSKKYNFSNYYEIYEEIITNLSFDRFFLENYSDLNKKNLDIMSPIEIKTIKKKKIFTENFFLYNLINEKFAIYCLKNNFQKSIIKNFGLDFLSDILNFSKITFLSYINDSFYSNYIFNSEKILILNDMFQFNHDILRYESVYINLLVNFGSRFIVKFYPLKRKNIVFKIKNLKIFNDVLLLQKNFIINLGMIKNYNNDKYINLSVFLVEKPLRNLKIVEFNKCYNKKAKILNFSFDGFYGWISFINLYYSFNIGYFNDEILLEVLFFVDEIDENLINSYLKFNMLKLLAHHSFSGRGILYAKINMNTFNVCINKIKSLENQADFF